MTGTGPSGPAQGPAHIAEDVRIDRIVDGLRSRNWETVFARWFDYESKIAGGVPLREDELERIASTYVRLIAKDMLEALDFDGLGASDE